MVIEARIRNEKGEKKNIGLALKEEATNIYAPWRQSSADQGTTGQKGQSRSPGCWANLCS